MTSKELLFRTTVREWIGICAGFKALLIQSIFIFKGTDDLSISCFLPPKCTCSFPNWPRLSVRTAIKINGYNCGSLSPLLSYTLALLFVSISPAVVRVPADEDGTAQAQHIHHPLPAVDHCHRAYLPRGDPRGEASETQTPHCSQSTWARIIRMLRFGPECYKVV